MSLIHLFKRLKDYNLDLIGYSLIQDLGPAHQIVQNIPENFCPCLYLLIEQVNRT